MTEDELKQLKTQVEEEAKALREAPVIQPILGNVRRCHICGQVGSEQVVTEFDTHIRHTRPRLACRNCHPGRSNG